MTDNAAADGAQPGLGLLNGWLSRDELAKELRVSPKTIKRWDSERTGPPFTQIGMKKYYNRDSVRAWLLSRESAQPRAAQAKGAGSK